MDIQNNIDLEAFGKIIREQRKNLFPHCSQDRFAKKANDAFTNNPRYSNNINFEFTQKNISMIENGKKVSKLTKEAVLVLKELCKLEDKDVLPVINIISSVPRENKTILIKSDGHLLADKNHPNFKIYFGEYHCLFYSTSSDEPKCIRGKMIISPSEYNNQCEAQITLYDPDNEDKEIKWYNGVFTINDFYNMWYCILIGKHRQEICMIASTHIHNSIHNNFLNVALVITTSAGYQKRPTMHRMIISKKKIEDNQLEIIVPHLKLNSDTISISETKLKALADEIDNKMNICEDPSDKEKYHAIKNCIEKIYAQGKKETYYTIDEALFYDTKTISEDKKLRGYAVSKLRQATDKEYYNKISQTIYNICADIIGK